MFWRVVKVGLLSGTIVGTAYTAHKNDWDVSNIGLFRFGRAAATVARIALDYKINLKGLEIDSDKYRDIKSKIHSRSAELLLDLCSKNGGVFIKVGQHVGAMDYMLPKEYTSVLSVLHSRAPKSSLDDVFQVLKEDLGKEPAELFTEFDEEPTGAASLAQVHRAVLQDGREVAVKVQHPRVMSHSLIDITSMSLLVNIIDWLFPEFSLMWLAREMRQNLPLELDFLHEGENAEHVVKILKFPWLKVPDIYWDLSSPRVLTMEYCVGGQVNDKEYMKKNSISPETISEQLGKLYSEMIFVKGYVHCDPHPGNILVNKTSKGVDIVLLDHGLYTTLSDQFRLEYSNLWWSLLQADVEGIKYWAKKLGVGEHYGLLACVMTARSWKSVQEGINRKQKTDEESAEIQEYAVSLMPEIAVMLGKVPPEMLLIFKTNDLLRGIETNLGTYGPTSFISMSQCCIRTIAAEKLKRCESLWCYLYIHLSRWWSEMKINLYKLFLQFYRFREILPIRNVYPVLFHRL